MTTFKTLFRSCCMCLLSAEAVYVPLVLSSSPPPMRKLLNDVGIDERDPFEKEMGKHHFLFLLLTGVILFLWPRRREIDLINLLLQTLHREDKEEKEK